MGSSSRGAARPTEPGPERVPQADLVGPWLAWAPASLSPHMTADGSGRGQRPRGTWRPGATEPRRVRASLGDAASLLGAEGAVDLAALRGQWPELVGDEVAAHSWPVALRGGVLTVGTDHPGWASELRLLSGELLVRLVPSGLGISAVVVQVSLSRGPGW
jgi:hypothetical protein